MELEEIKDTPFMYLDAQMHPINFILQLRPVKNDVKFVAVSQLREALIHPIPKEVFLKQQRTITGINVFLDSLQPHMIVHRMVKIWHFRKPQTGAGIAREMIYNLL